MPIWKYLHILSMFSAVTLLVGGDILFHALRRSGDLGAVRRFLAAVNPLFGLGVALLSLGVALGLVTVASGGWSFTAGWLVGAYVIVGLLYLVGLTVGLPYYRGVSAALRSEAQTAGRDDATANRALADVRGWGSMAISIVGYAAIIFLMVLKPFA